MSYQPTLKEKFSNLIDVLQVYSGEITIYPRLLVPTDLATTTMQQFAYRAMVRTVYSSIEAVTYLMKQISLSEELHPTTIFSPAELALLREEEYYLDGNGKAQTRPARLSALNNVRFGFETISRAAHTKFTLPVHEEGWRLVREGITIRDQITHPKRAKDLYISDQQRDTVLDGHIWFANNAATCITAARSNLSDHLD